MFQQVKPIPASLFVREGIVCECCQFIRRMGGLRFRLSLLMKKGGFARGICLEAIRRMYTSGELVFYKPGVYEKTRKFVLPLWLSKRHSPSSHSINLISTRHKEIMRAMADERKGRRA